MIVGVDEDFGAGIVGRTQRPPSALRILLGVAVVVVGLSWALHLERSADALRRAEPPPL